MSRPDGEGPDQGSIDPPGGAEAADAGSAFAEVGGEALDEARRAAAGAQVRVRAELEARSTDAGARLTRAGEDLRAVADELAERGSAEPAKLAATAAQQSRRLGTYLTQSDADRLLADAEDLLRRQPAAVAAGAALAGFVAARFLKASAYRRHAQRAGQAADRASGVPTMQPGGVDPAPSAPAADASAEQAVER